MNVVVLEGFLILHHHQGKHKAKRFHEKSNFTILFPFLGQAQMIQGPGVLFQDPAHQSKVQQRKSQKFKIGKVF